MKIVFFSPKFLPEHFHCFDEVARLNAFEIALKSFNQHQILFKNYFLSSDFKSLEGIFGVENPHEGLARILITSKSTNREVASLHICVKWSIQYILRWQSCTKPSRHGKNKLNFDKHLHTAFHVKKRFTMYIIKVLPIQ